MVECIWSTEQFERTNVITAFFSTDQNSLEWPKPRNAMHFMDMRSLFYHELVLSHR